jgi:hypothetical protein
MAHHRHWSLLRSSPTCHAEYWLFVGLFVQTPQGEALCRALYFPVGQARQAWIPSVMLEASGRSVPAGHCWHVTLVVPNPSHADNTPQPAEHLWLWVKSCPSHHRHDRWPIPSAVVLHSMYWPLWPQLLPAHRAHEFTPVL